jgi:hypothetical protein
MAAEEIKAGPLPVGRLWTSADGRNGRGGLVISSVKISISP